MSRTGCHGACRALVSARAQSMCGVFVLFWGFDKTRRVSLLYTQRGYLSCR